MEVTHIEDYKQRTFQKRLDEQGKPEIEAKYPEKKSKGRPKLLVIDRMNDDQEIDELENWMNNYD